MDKVEEIHGFLKLLITPISCVSSTSEHKRLENSLRTNLETTLNVLNSKEFVWLKESMDEINLEGNYEDVCWQFTSCIAKTLVCLSDALSSAQKPKHDEENEQQRSTKVQPVILSVHQQQDVQLSLQFLTCFGIGRNLLPGVGIPLWRRSQFGQLLETSTSREGTDFEKYQMLYSTVRSLFSLCRNATFGSVILSKFLGDFLAALCQLCYAPLKKKCSQEDETIEDRESNGVKLSTADEAKRLINEQITRAETDRKHCFVILNCILECTLKPKLVRELLLLQGSPSKSGVQLTSAPNWLRKATQKLLTETMMKKNGVLAVILGIVVTEGSETSIETSDWKKCNIVADLIARKLKAEACRASIATQVLDLLDSQLEFSNSHFGMVASATIRNVFLIQPTIAAEIFLEKLMKPLIVCSEDETFDRQLGDRLTACILKLHMVYVSQTDPNGKFLQSLSAVVSLLIHMYTFVRNGVSYLKKPIEELLTSYLKHVESSVALDTLKEILFGGIDGSKVRAWNPALELSLDDKAELKVTETQSLTTSETKWLEDDTTKASAVLSLLSHLQNDDIVCNIFLSQLENLTDLVDDDEVDPLESIPSTAEGQSDLLHLERHQTTDLAKTRRSLLNLQILSALCEEPVLQESIMKDKMQAMQFLMVTLERSVTLCQTRTNESKPMESETLMMVMGILTLVLGSQESVESKAVLKNCASHLSKLKNKHPSEDVRVMAAELEMAITTNDGTTKQRKQKKSTKKQSELTKYQEAWEDLQDPEIPIRGHAILTMTKLITTKDKETLKNRDKLLVAFMEHLKHEDSYVYMMAIQGLTALADQFPDTVIPVLIEEFGSSSSRLPIEMRMKLGEVLVKVTRTLGEMTPKYRDELLNAFLSTSRHSEPMMRSSSLSNLGEVCKELRYALGPNVHEVFNCLSSFAKYDSAVHVRRAAVQVIVLLLRGLGKDAFRTLEAVMKDLYTLVKHLHRVDDDETVKLHAQLALEELDVICKDFLFPKPTFDKKIRVLDA